MKREVRKSRGLSRNRPVRAPVVPAKNKDHKRGTALRK